MCRWMHERPPQRSLCGFVEGHGGKAVDWLSGCCPARRPHRLIGLPVGSPPPEPNPPPTLPRPALQLLLRQERRARHALLGQRPGRRRPRRVQVVCGARGGGAAAGRRCAPHHPGIAVCSCQPATYIHVYCLDVLPLCFTRLAATGLSCLAPASPRALSRRRGHGPLLKRRFNSVKLCKRWHASIGCIPSAHTRAAACWVPPLPLCGPRRVAGSCMPSFKPSHSTWRLTVVVCAVGC